MNFIVEDVVFVGANLIPCGSDPTLFLLLQTFKERAQHFVNQTVQNRRFIFRDEEEAKENLELYYYSECAKIGIRSGPLYVHKDETSFFGGLVDCVSFQLGKSGEFVRCFRSRKIEKWYLLLPGAEDTYTPVSFRRGEAGLCIDCRDTLFCMDCFLNDMLGMCIHTDTKGMVISIARTRRGNPATSNVLITRITACMQGKDDTPRVDM
eukprot:TRINITY_DN1972_c0_g3_i2.p1 TRINITY_DN1972_c0_g3~~TRINITY_DN1972_c0_g3_i2.p1  ORF type:complete len:208 (-),score=26.81 TRINITY_DN1972_c0_g3_i2:117-740(-)